MFLIPVPATRLRHCDATRLRIAAGRNDQTGQRHPIRFRRAFQRFVLGFAALWIASTSSPATAFQSVDSAEATPSRPNILFVYLDDFGWRDAGFSGSDFYETPHLDRLAASGLVFTNAYSCAANCAPARASLLSGTYSPRHQIFNVGTRARGKKKHRRLKHIPGTDTLDPQTRTWAQDLQAAGYATGSFGKWHVSDDPVLFGFDRNIAGDHRGSPPRGYYPPHPRAAGLEDAPDEEYLTDRLTDETIRFVREHRDQSWCAYLTHFAVHTPLNAKKELLEKYEQKPAGELHNHIAMATMIQAVDDGVGRLIAVLEELNLFENTVIVFCSDNGGYGPATSMAPLRGYKGTYYEGGIRVPMFVHWPAGQIETGSTDIPVTGVDFYPTLVEIGNCEIQPDRAIDGISLLPILKGELSEPELEPLLNRPLYWHFPAYLQSYGNNPIDGQRDPLFRSRPCSVIRRGNFKLLQYFESGEIELFDLGSDIGETTNLATSNAEVAGQLLQQLQQWQTETEAPIPQEANPDFDEQAERTAIERLLNPAG